MRAFRRVLIAGFEHLLCPERVIYIGTAADFKDVLVLFIIPHKGLISAIKIGVIFWCHVAAAAPILISHAKVINLPGLLMAVLFAKLRHRGDTVEGHVLHPL